MKQAKLAVRIDDARQVMAEKRELLSHGREPRAVWQDRVQHPIECPPVYESQFHPAILGSGDGLPSAVTEVVRRRDHHPVPTALEHHGTEEIAYRGNALGRIGSLPPLGLDEPLRAVTLYEENVHSSVVRPSDVDNL